MENSLTINDFENEALEIMMHSGITFEHIMKQKTNTFNVVDFHNYYDKVENSRISCVAIPVEKIVAIDTGWKTEGSSVYDLFMGKIESGTKKRKIRENLNSLRENGYSAQKDFYTGKTQIEESNSIDFHYYQEADCYIPNEGTHRTISAKMFGVPFMSGNVTTYKLNKEKKNLYDEYNNLKKSLFSTNFKGLTLKLLNNEEEYFDTANAFEVYIYEKTNYITKIHFQNPESFSAKDIEKQAIKNRELKDLIRKKTELLQFFSEYPYKKLSKPLLRVVVLKRLNLKWKLNSFLFKKATKEKRSCYHIRLESISDLNEEMKEEIVLHIRKYIFNRRLFLTKNVN